LTATNEPRPATQKQQGLILKLCRQQKKNLPPGLITGTLTIGEASSWIDGVLSQVKSKECFK
jgi:hypothetical protein